MLPRWKGRQDLSIQLHPGTGVSGPETAHLLPIPRSESVTPHVTEEYNSQASPARPCDASRASSKQTCRISRRVGGPSNTQRFTHCYIRYGTQGIRIEWVISCRQSLITLISAAVTNMSRNVLRHGKRGGRTPFRWAGGRTREATTWPKSGHHLFCRSAAVISILCRSTRSCSVRSTQGWKSTSTRGGNMGCFRAAVDEVFGVPEIG